jgi:hypothetical protein
MCFSIVLHRVECKVLGVSWEEILIIELGEGLGNIEKHLLLCVVLGREKYCVINVGLNGVLKVIEVKVFIDEKDIEETLSQHIKNNVKRLQM